MKLHEALKLITGGFESISDSATKMFESFKNSVNSIVPKLNQEERDQFNNAFSRYTTFLMDTQEFISCTEVGVKYAETLEDLCKAVPVDLLQTLMVNVQNLLKDFENLEWVVKAKLKEDKTISYFKNIMIGVATLGVGFALIGTGLGAVAGLSAVALKNIAIIGVVSATVGATGAAVAHCAMQTSDIGKILQTLKEIQKCLNDIAKEQANLKGKNSGIKGLTGRSSEMEMKILNDQRKEFEDILKKTQTQVNRGFDILKK